MSIYTSRLQINNSTLILEPYTYYKTNNTFSKALMSFSSLYEVRYIAYNHF